MGIIFDAVVEATGGNNAAIVVPAPVIEQLGAGQRPAVVAKLGGHEMQTTVGVMKGRHLISVNAATRKTTGLAPGDAVRVELALATAPRTFEVPVDLAAALSASPSASAFFAGLSNSQQRYHVDNVNGAKTTETRARRVAKAIELFEAGKAR